MLVLAGLWICLAAALWGVYALYRRGTRPVLVKTKPCDCPSLLSPGEMADRLTILCLKLSKGITAAEAEMYNTSKLVGRMLAHASPDEWKKFWQFSAELLCLNLSQWDWEDQVRSEQSAAAALGARRNNTLRVQKKNEINQLLGYSLEQKRYSDDCTRATLP